VAQEARLAALRDLLAYPANAGARPQQNSFEVFIPRERLIHTTREQEREMKSFAWALAQQGWTIQFDQDVMRDGWWIRGWYGPRPLPERAGGTERRFREAR
jgi:hypothetical protein